MTKNIDNLLIHPKTKKQAELFLHKSVNSLLILGEPGSGKLNIAMALASDLLKLKTAAELSNYPYFLKLSKSANKQDISIDEVRGTIKLLRLKTPGSNLIRRVIVIDNAQNLSHEAQNALLKILEEPNSDTVFILTTPYEFSLLPTIISRCRKIQVYPVSLEQADEFFRQHYPPKKLGAAWQLSQGSASLLEALLKDDKDHPLKQSVDLAKKFIGKSRYERLLIIEQMGNNKESFRLFLEALRKVLNALHHSVIMRNNAKRSEKMLLNRKLLRNLSGYLDKNANLKLISLELMLRLEI